MIMGTQKYLLQLLYVVLLPVALTGVSGEVITGKGYIIFL